MTESFPDGKIQSLITATAVLRTVDHILRVSTDLPDARRQVATLLSLVHDKAQEERIPDAMLRGAGRDSLMDLL